MVLLVIVRINQEYTVGLKFQWLFGCYFCFWGLAFTKTF